MSNHVMVVEDNADLRELLCVSLQRSGYTVTAAACGDDFQKYFEVQSFDLILLDLNLPDHDGMTLLQTVRAQSRAPIFVVSGRADEATRLRALELGADDYLPKPINLRELTLRVSNFLRRQNERTLPASGSWQFAHWILHVERRTVMTADTGDTLGLTRGEFNVLYCLVQGMGNVVSREEILKAAGQLGTSMHEDSLTTVVYRLRQKLRSSSPGEAVIVTVPGVGFRIEPQVTRLYS